jgi:formylglycine-generating enzyme required for sulfatase activity
METYRRAAGRLRQGWLLCALTALTAQAVSASQAATGMVYTVSSPIPLFLRWVPGGEFRMGDLSGTGQEDERPVRTVEVSDFWMMHTEVTVEMFRKFVVETGHDIAPGCGYFDDGWKTGDKLDWESPGFSQGPDHPVTCVSWEDAMAFSMWVSLETGLDFSLPTEAQWEYAARASTRSAFVHGPDAGELCAHANGADRRALSDYPGFDVNTCDDGFTRTAPVGSYPANAWGLHDMTGNVWEWVADCWPANYSSAPLDGTAFLGGACERRGYRGGAYGDVPFFLRVSLRNRGYPGERRDDVGFRLVLRDF